ncbi:MAG TPA: hypothetical protein VNA20_13415 [Frankiaceae bacterium]|nr:hypothetical protein [Frankiaceae bacterium]
MVIDSVTIQLFVAGLVFFTVILAVAARLPKRPRQVELTMHVERGSGPPVDIVIRGAADDDVEAMLAGVARRIAGDDPAQARVDATPA